MDYYVGLVRPTAASAVAAAEAAAAVVAVVVVAALLPPPEPPCLGLRLTHLRATASASRAFPGSSLAHFTLCECKR